MLAVNQRRPTPAMVIVAGLTAAIYLATLGFGFTYLDDYLLVEQAGFYAKLGSLITAFRRPVWLGGSGSSYSYYRPVSTAFYVVGGWVSHTMTGEVGAWVFHLINLVLFAAFLALLVPFLKSLDVRATPARATATLATLLFAMHPATIGTIAWICGQNELLLAVLVIAAWLAMRGGRPFRHGLFFLLALLTKENAIALPVLCSIYLLKIREPRASRREWAVFAGVWLGVVVACFALARFVAGLSQQLDIQAALASIIRAFPDLMIYLGRLTLPFNLPVLPIARDIGMLSWAAGIVAAALIALAGVKLKDRKRWLVILGVAWFSGFLLPTVIQQGVAAGDTFILRGDRGFLASVGILIVGLQVDWPHLWARISAMGIRGTRASAKTPGLHGRRALLALFLATVLLGIDAFRIGDYHSGMAFYQSAVEGSPSLAFAHAHLGDMEIAAKDYPSAIAEYKAAVALNDAEPQAHNNLGVVYLRMQDLDRAAAEFRAELKTYPGNVLSLFNLGVIQFNQGNYDGAEQIWLRAVEVNPSYSSAWDGLIKLYSSAKKDEKKLEWARRSLEKNGEWDLSRGI